MLDILTISWIVGFIGVIIAIIGLIIYVQNVRNLETIDVNVKEALFYMGITAVAVTIYSSIIVFFGIIKLETTNMWWIIFPILYVLVGISWGFGTYKLMKIVMSSKEAR